MDTRSANRLRRARGLWALVRENPDVTSVSEIVQAVDAVMTAPAVSGQPAMVELLRTVNRTLKPAVRGGAINVSDVDDAMEALGAFVGRRTDARPAQGQATLFGRTVFVAVSNSDFADALCPQLELFQYVAVRVSSPEELVTRGQVESPGVIVVDADFGGLDAGLSACHQLGEALGEHVPALVLSPNDDFRTRLNVVRIGGVRLFTKLPEPVAVVEEIRRVLQRDQQAPIRAMICDDSSVNAYRVQVDLEAAGMQVSALTDPTNIISTMAEFRPEILLLDLYQPAASGVEIARLVRMDDRFISIPIVFISNETDPDRQAYVMVAGDEFVEKPYNANRLVQTVRNRVARAREIKRLMSTDSMTGLLDHRHVMEALDGFIEQAARTGKPLVFTMIDIDHFKLVNDTHGHAVGDVVINSLALLLKQRLRGDDCIGRYGGEEFAVILPDTPAEHAVTLIDDLRQRFSAIQHASATTPFSCTLSAGVAMFTHQAAAALASDADEALYSAKRGGRNRVTLAPAIPHSGGGARTA